MGQVKVIPINCGTKYCRATKSTPAEPSHAAEVEVKDKNGNVYQKEEGVHAYPTYIIPCEDDKAVKVTVTARYPGWVSKSVTYFVDDGQVWKPSILLTKKEK